MGDLGYFDADGRLWFCGRKSQRVVTNTGTLCTEHIEPVFNVHPEVRHTALAGVGERGAHRPLLTVALRAGLSRAPRTRLPADPRPPGESLVHASRVHNFLLHTRTPA